MRARHQQSAARPLHGRDGLIVLQQRCNTFERAIRRHSVDAELRATMAASEQRLVVTPGVADCIGLGQVNRCACLQAHSTVRSILNVETPGLHYIAPKRSARLPHSLFSFDSRLHVRVALTLSAEGLLAGSCTGLRSIKCPAGAHIESACVLQERQQVARSI